MPSPPILSLVYTGSPHSKPILLGFILMYLVSKAKMKQSKSIDYMEKLQGCKRGLCRMDPQPLIFNICDMTYKAL